VIGQSPQRVIRVDSVMLALGLLNPRKRGNSRHPGTSRSGHNRTKAGVLREARYVLADITTLTCVIPAAQVRPPIVARSRFDNRGR